MSICVCVFVSLCVCSSIAIGHPFAATGGRLMTTAINELRRSKKRYALLSICAAGGMGGACIIERRETAS